jgi:hypothetical protein
MVVGVLWTAAACLRLATNRTSGMQGALIRLLLLLFTLSFVLGVVMRWLRL